MNSQHYRYTPLRPQYKAAMLLPMILRVNQSQQYINFFLLCESMKTRRFKRSGRCLRIFIVSPNESFLPLGFRNSNLSDLKLGWDTNSVNRLLSIMVGITNCTTLFHFLGPCIPPTVGNTMYQVHFLCIYHILGDWALILKSVFPELSIWLSLEVYSIIICDQVSLSDKVSWYEC